jgi:hypothetical protein
MTAHAAKHYDAIARERFNGGSKLSGCVFGQRPRLLALRFGHIDVHHNGSHGLSLHRPGQGSQGTTHKLGICARGNTHNALRAVELQEQTCRRNR